MNYSQPRTDQEWLDALTGALGAQTQANAFQELANYLYVVCTNNLVKRQSSLASLKSLSDDELSAIAEELVQDFMEKMFCNNFALLDKYSGHGSFLGWVAQVANNLCSSEMRRSCWRRNEPLNEQHMNLPSKISPPEQTAMHGQIRDTLLRCLNRLPERYRFALIQCVLEGQSASEVGNVLEISANAVHILVYRAKKMMQKYLEREGMGIDVIAAFAN